MSEHTKYLLGEDRIPHAWYNIIADLPSPPPPVLHPGTGKPVGPDDLSPLFPMALIGQEVSGERHIEIPKPVRDIYRMWRPTPLYRARRLEKAAGHNRAHFLQIRGRQPRRQPQT
jgi:tryptophan synthase beta chain